MKLNKLKVSGKHPQWCGPSALSIITGRTVNYCAKLCADAANNYRFLQRPHTSRTIKGVYNSEMKIALRSMGFVMKKLDVPMAPTLRAYMAERGGPDWKTTLLLQVGNHYVVANRDSVSDNHAEDFHYQDHPYRLKRVKKIWRIERRKRKVA